MRKLFIVLLLAFTFGAVTGFANLTQIEQDVGKSVIVKTADVSIAPIQVVDSVDVNTCLKQNINDNIFLQKTIAKTPATATATIPSLKKGNRFMPTHYNKSRADQVFRTKTDYTIYNEGYRTNYTRPLKVISACQYNYKRARDGLIRG